MTPDLEPAVPKAWHAVEGSTNNKNDISVCIVAGSNGLAGRLLSPSTAILKSLCNRDLTIHAKKKLSASSWGAALLTTPCNIPLTLITDLKATSLAVDHRLTKPEIFFVKVIYKRSIRR